MDRIPDETLFTINNTVSEMLIDRGYQITNHITTTNELLAMFRYSSPEILNQAAFNYNQIVPQNEQGKLLTEVDSQIFQSWIGTISRFNQIRPRDVLNRIYYKTGQEGGILVFYGESTHGKDGEGGEITKITGQKTNVDTQKVRIGNRPKISIKMKLGKKTTKIDTIKEFILTIIGSNQQLMTDLTQFLQIELGTNVDIRDKIIKAIEHGLPQPKIDMTKEKNVNRRPREVLDERIRNYIIYIIRINIQINRSIFIIEGKMSDKANALLLLFGRLVPEHKVEIHRELNLMYNPTRHILTPRHILLSKEDGVRILKEMQVDISHIPIISIEDPISKYYGFPLGGIIKLERDDSDINPLNPEGNQYRIVI